jgi:hypothetical protein
MSSIINNFKNRAIQNNGGVDKTGAGDAQRIRGNYAVLANAVELSTLIVAGVINDSLGVSGTVGGNDLSKSEISDLATVHFMGAVESKRGLAND